MAERGSALWGTGGKGDDARGSALWGKGGRGAVLLAVVATALAIPAAGLSAGGNGNGSGQAVVPTSLIQAATASPDKIFHVIVQGTPGRSSHDVAGDIAAANGQAKRTFFTVDGASADLTGKQVLQLAKRPYVGAITPDYPVRPSTYEDGTMWQASADLTPLEGTLTSPGPATPTIAVIDSGIDATRAADFGARIVASVNFDSSDPGATGDAEGHGTLVAGIAAGASAAYPGGAPQSKLVDVRTANAQGASYESDVVAACDWVLQHKDQFGIRVVNMSMAGSTDVSYRTDPLDQAVEKLWLNGLVVVTAAGNNGTGNGPVDVSYAPGNDPFVIDVGATDQHQTAVAGDDTIPYWSSYGTTLDGFAKPDLSAPGRYIIGPVSAGTTIANTVPDRIVAPGYMWMSGTSLAAPVVSAAAAQILARHPGWTPDQVKGALMLTAQKLPLDTAFAGGVGEVDAAAAAAVIDPPNPNLNLLPYVGSDPATGLRSFDANGWENAVGSNPHWTQANWTDVSWDSVSWDSVSWDSISWDSSTWAASTSSAIMSSSVSWDSVSWDSVSWSE